MKSRTKDSRGTLRILVVDDDEDWLFCLTSALRVRVDVDAVTSFEAALEKLDRESYDVVLSDHQLSPGLGTVLLEEVRVRAPNARRFLMSGLDVPASFVGTPSWEQFFLKPFDPRAVVLAARERAVRPSYRRR